MHERKLTERILQIIEDVTGITLSPTDRLNYMGVDSLSLVSIIAMVEEKFGFFFSDDDLQPDNLQTAKDIVVIAGKYV